MTLPYFLLCDSNISTYEPNNDMQKISEWAYTWKMSFNPDLNKQAQEVIFSRKLTKFYHPKIFFNNAPVFCANWQQHLGMHLDETFNFNLHIKGIVKWAEPCKCVILLVSMILWHKRINSSLKEWRLWYLILTSHFPP